MAKNKQEAKKIVAKQQTKKSKRVSGIVLNNNLPGVKHGGFLATPRYICPFCNKKTKKLYKRDGGKVWFCLKCYETQRRQLMPAQALIF